VVVLAPRRDVKHAAPEQSLESLPRDSGIELIASFPRDCRARQFWTTYRKRWVADIRDKLPTADVVHSGFCDVYKPINFTGHLEALRAGKPTVFVQDTDVVLQQRELAQDGPVTDRMRAYAYCAIYERSVRYGVATADLSLLKGRALHERYVPYARNAKDFEDTSYLSSEIVSGALLDARLATLFSDRPLRLVYCGRFEKRKGVATSIELVGAARREGAQLELDLIGDGPEREVLQALGKRLGADRWLRFLGKRGYGPDLLRELAGYDALLFTPLAEDTPRMIFDGYAAGLPLIGSDIEYVRSCSLRDKAALVLPARDREKSVRTLVDFSKGPQDVAALSRAALAAAHVHAADAWYRRRANWTFEAVALHRQRE
jgi:glycosyltransferase involved in cell wall biosynthesis